MLTPVPSRVQRGATDVLVVLVTLLATGMGGSTQLWTQALLLLGLAGVWGIDPPERLPPTWLLLPAGVLAVWPLLAFLPAGGVGLQDYRLELLALTDLDLGDRIGVQPWVTLETLILWWTGLAWALMLACRNWTLSRVWLLRLWVGGTLMLALIALTVHAVGRPVAGWQPGHGFGFFPNRNHTANVLALAALISLALGGREAIRGRPVAWVWFGGYLLLGVALVVNGSRAGILLYLGGALVWTVWTAVMRASMRRLGWGLAMILALLAAFLVFGGPTLERFIRPGEPVPSLADELLRRTDPGAYRLAAEASWHGIGLGNFTAVFPQYAEELGLEKRAVHPESDWVWLRIELGWIGLVLTLGLVLCWLVRHRPRVGEPDFLLRTALVLAGALFLLHGFADVSGHRPGALWPALFCVALLREPLAQQEGGRRRGRVLRWTHRVCAVPFLGVALIWLLPPATHPWPSSAQAAQLRERMELGMAAGAYANVMSDADRLLRWSSLDSGAHFFRALAGAYGGAQMWEPVRDFMRASALDPRNPRVALHEGMAWLLREPTLAFPAWAEALRRAGPARARYYREIVRTGREVPVARHELFSLALDDPELLLVFLQDGPPEEFQQEIERWLLTDPALLEFDADQRRQLLTLWVHQGDPERLADWLESHPEHLPVAWPARALVLAQAGNHQAACELAARFVPIPTLPQRPSEHPEPVLRRRLLLDPHDPAAAYALFESFRGSGRTDEALQVLRSAIGGGRAPAYFHYLLARVLTEQEDWEEAWRAWQRLIR